MRSLRLKEKREKKEEIWQKIQAKMIRQVRRNFSHLQDKQDEILGVSCIPYVIINNVIQPLRWERMRQGTLIQGQGLQRRIKTKYIRSKKRCE